MTAVWERSTSSSALEHIKESCVLTSCILIPICELGVRQDSSQVHVAGDPSALPGKREGQHEKGHSLSRRIKAAFQGSKGRSGPPVVE